MKHQINRSCTCTSEEKGWTESLDTWAAESKHIWDETKAWNREMFKISSKNRLGFLHQQMMNKWFSFFFSFIMFHCHLIVFQTFFTEPFLAKKNLNIREKTLRWKRYIICFQIQFTVLWQLSYWSQCWRLPLIRQLVFQRGEHKVTRVQSFLVCQQNNMSNFVKRL